MINQRESEYVTWAEPSRSAGAAGHPGTLHVQAHLSGEEVEEVKEILGFSRQEHWSGLPFPSPMHEREK